MPAPDTLDPDQLKRIEGTHRGFLYQHLYAVACLLCAQEAKAKAVAVETDEDIELRFPDGRIYIQVRTRSEPLQPSDISGTLERFGAIRAAHTSGECEGNFVFCVVSNSAPGPQLLANLESPDWSQDTALMWPGGALSAVAASRVDCLPPPFEGVGESASSCADRAKLIPFGKLSAETLVWKMAALVQCASAGEAPYAAHEFNVEDLPALFEQVIIQLQEFPEPPSPYRPLADEPQLESDARVQLVVGLSGSGKTSWASQQAIHYKSLIAYYNVSGSSTGQLASALARELGAKWLAQNDGALASVLFPGSSGLDSLRVVGLT